MPLTLRQLAARSGVSISHLARIESGSRFPSATVLAQIAKPLGFTESELLVLAGYMSPQPWVLREEREEYIVGRLDARVARVLAQEPVEVQRAVVALLPILKRIAKEIDERLGERLAGGVAELAIRGDKLRPRFRSGDVPSPPPSSRRQAAEKDGLTALNNYQLPYQSTIARGLNA